MAHNFKKITSGSSTAYIECAHKINKANQSVVSPKPTRLLMKTNDMTFK